MGRRRGLVGVLLCAALTACDLGGAASTAPPADALSMERSGPPTHDSAVQPSAPELGLPTVSGAAPGVAWAADAVLVLPGGDEHALKGPVSALRQVRDGLLATTGTELRDDLVLVRRGRATTLAEGVVVGGLAVDRTGDRVAWSTERERVVLDLASRRELARSTWAVSGAGTPAGWSGDAVLLTAGDGADVRVERWDWQRGRSTRVRPGSWTVVADVTADGRRLAARQGDGPCLELGALTGPTVLVDCQTGPVRFSPSGRRLAALSWDGRPGPVVVRDGRTGAVVTTLDVQSPHVLDLGWEDDVSLLLLVRDGARVQPVRCDVVSSTCALAGGSRVARSAVVARRG